MDSTATQPLRVLFVEDNEMEAVLLDHVLRQGGYQTVSERVCTAADLRQALGRDDWQLILSDYCMPQLDGLQALHICRENGCLAPFILVSGVMGEEAAAQAMRDGANDYLSKQNLARLVPVVARALHEAEQRRQRERAESALVEGEEMFRALSVCSPVGVCLTDAAGRFLYVNPRWRDIFGRSFTESLRDGWTKDLHPDDRQRVTTAWYAYAATGGEFNMEFRLRQPDGSTRWLHARAARRLSDKGALLGFVGTVEDISERKRTEEALVEANRELGATLEQLRETQRQIIQTERLRALGQMASGIAHDINNSLACILGFSDLLLSHPKNLDDKRKLAEFLMFINIAARDAGNVVHRLREFYRKRDDHGQLSSVNLNQIARDAVALSEPRWKTQAQSDGINVQIQIDLGDIPEIIGQPTELRETLMNLIFNAVDALIFARRDGVITLHTRTADAGVLVEVSDDGDGMADEVRAHCLEPFFTTKGERGTGLGMATVYGVVQRHQGNIDIRSAPDQGTAVTIWLPLPPPAQPQQAAPRSAEGRPSRSLRVLLVEDEATIQEMMAACLMEDGHEVELAGDGVAALEKFQEGRFDVVITDHAMPRMNGADMAAVIRKQSPRQPIVFLTGFGDMINDVTRQPVPTKHIIGKPVSIKVLREVLVRATSEEA